jgi:hypothetical protein
MSILRDGHACCSFAGLDDQPGLGQVRRLFPVFEHEMHAATVRGHLILHGAPHQLRRGFARLGIRALGRHWQQARGNTH